jgi:hypothetical protein
MSYYDERSIVDGPDLGYQNPRVIMIRRIKGVILVILLVLMILLMYIQFDSSMKEYDDFHYEPILPIEPILFALLLIAFIMTIVGIVFKVVEIKVSETGSQKYLLAHSSMKAAISTMIIAIVFALIIYILPTLPASEDLLNSEEKGVAEYGNQTFSFNSQDEFLISETTAVEFKVTNGLDVNATIYPKNEYEAGNLGSEVKEANSKLKWPDGTTDYKFEGVLPYGKYQIVLENDNFDNANVEYTVHRKVRDPLLWTLLIFCIMFAILEGIWVGVTVGIKQKYKGESILR